MTNTETARFQFGANWQSFLNTLDDTRIEGAQRRFIEMAELDTLEGMRFVDVGCGSGLHSLVARRLGAQVHAFDYDAQSVAASQEIRRRYAPDDPDWHIEQGSVLDEQYLASLGTFDVVYSWGVLHHTGAMWQALENVIPLVKPGGMLFIGIYNDQGKQSQRWRAIKRFYSTSPRWIQRLMVLVIGGWWELRGALIRLIKGKNPLPFQRWRDYKQQRGMSVWHDYIDWIGGYPFEVAKPEEIFRFYRERGFTLRNLRTVGGGLAVNEFVFRCAE